MRGEILEATVQKAKRMGRLVNMAKNSQVYRPPLTLRARKAGTTPMRATRRMLEKFSLPAASAGKGAFLIDGN